MPGGYPVDTTLTNPNDSLSRFGNKVGPSLVLKVMSGDVVDIGVKCFYWPQGGGSTTHENPLTDIFGVLASGITGVVGESKGTQGDLANPGTSPLLGALNSFLDNRDTSQSGKPRAYLNCLPAEI